MSDLVKRLRFDAVRSELQFSKGVAMNIDEAAAEIERLRAEIADLTKANVLLHGIVSNREEEISGLRAQLASASERVAEMQYEAGMYHSLYDVATERLASARKALEWVESWVHNPVGSYSVAALDGLFAMTRDRIAALSLTDEQRK